MKPKKWTNVLALVVAVVASGSVFSVRTSSQDFPHLKLLGNIPIPAPNPIASTDIVWADQATGKVFFSDRSNAAVQVIDAATGLYVGSITKNAGGNLKFPGLAFGSVHEGPNGVVSTTDQKVWAADGDSTVKVTDFDPASPTYLQIIASVSTAGLTPISACTGGTAGSCNRDDEIGYDPRDQIIMVDNDEPTSIQPFATFISAKATAPGVYPVLGQINFAAQGLVASGGLEQPLWVPEYGVFLQTLPVTNAATGTGSIAVIDPLTGTVERVISLDGFHCRPTGEALAPGTVLAVVACSNTAGGAPSSFPLVIDIDTGTEIGPGINQVGGGDEVNQNPGNNTFIVASSLDAVSGNPIVLGVIDADSGTWIENDPPATPAVGATPGTGGLATSGRGGNLAAWGGNSHVFVVVHPAAAPGTDICGSFGAVDYGCVAVFGPAQ